MGLPTQLYQSLGQFKVVENEQRRVRETVQILVNIQTLRCS